jgi:hypothetical protein
VCESLCVCVCEKFLVPLISRSFYNYSRRYTLFQNVLAGAKAADVCPAAAFGCISLFLHNLLKSPCDSATFKPALRPAPSPRTMESLSAERQEKVQMLMALTDIEDVEARVILQKNDWQLELPFCNHFAAGAAFRLGSVEGAVFVFGG